MKKWELIGLTLEQLLERQRQNPESFEYSDKSYPIVGGGGQPTIYWQPKLTIKSDSRTISDPNESQKAVIITFNDFTNQLICYIHSAITTTGIKALESKHADASMVDDRNFIKYRANWRKFQQLANAIKEHDRTKENERYLKKLFSIFPGTLDKHLLGE